MPTKDQNKLTDIYYKDNDGIYAKLCVEDFNAVLDESEEQGIGYIRSVTGITTKQDLDLDKLEWRVRGYIRSTTRIVTTMWNGRLAVYIPRISKFNMLKISGALDWLIEHCPNRRVTHLMKHGKNDNVRYKNAKRAAKLIAKKEKE